MPDETHPMKTAPIAAMRVEVVFAVPGQAWSARLELPEGATAFEALAQSRFESLVPEFKASQLGYSIHGKPINASTVLRDGDRLELLRPLIADPKQARRNRARGRD